MFSNWCGDVFSEFTVYLQVAVLLFPLLPALATHSVAEFVEKGSLHSYLRNTTEIPENVMRQIVVGIAQGLLVRKKHLKSFEIF